MKFCPSCGTSLPPGAKFCASCGAALTPTSDAGSAPTAAPVTTDAGSAPTAAPLAAPAAGGTGSGVNLAVDPKTLVPAALGGLVAYGFALLTAIVSLVVSWIGTSMGSDSSSGSSSSSPVEDISFWDVITAVPVQAVSMSTFGTLRMVYNGEVIGHAWLPLLGVTAAAVAGAAWWARRRHDRSLSLAQLGIQSAVAGLVLATVSTLAAMLFALSVEEGRHSVAVDATSMGGFLGALLLGALGWFAGSWMMRQRTLPSSGPWAGALGTYGLHFGLATTLLLLVSAVYITVKGGLSDLVGMFPLWPQLLTYGYHILHFGDLDLMGEPAGLWDKASLLVKVLWILGLLLVALVAAVHWWIRRDRSHSVLNSVWGWAALPAVFTAGAALALMLTRVAGHMDFMYFDQSGKLALHGKVLLLAPLVGLLVEAASRYVAPHLVGMLPPDLLARWQKGAAAPATATATATAPSATATGETTSAATADSTDTTGATDASDSSVQDAATQAIPLAAAGSGSSAWSPQTDAGDHTASTGAAPLSATGTGADRTPMDPATKRKLLLVGGLLATLVVGLVALNLVGKFVGRTVFGPQKQVEAYMDAVVDGRGTDAMELSAPNIPTAQRSMMVDEVYKDVAKRPDSYELGEVLDNSEGEVVEVPVTYTQDGVSESATFRLERDGKQWLFFDKWTMQDGGPLTEQLHPMVQSEQTDGFVVNGRQVDSSMLHEGGLHVLPGEYTVTLPGSRFAASNEVRLVAGPAGTGQQEPLRLEPTQELTDEAIRQAKAHLAECVKSTEPGPDNCGFDVYVGDDVRNGSWTLDTEPTFTVEQGGFGGGTRVVTQEPGTATYSYEQDQDSFDDQEDWVAETQESDVRLDGVVSVEGDQLTVDFS